MCIRKNKGKLWQRTPALPRPIKLCFREHGLLMHSLRWKLNVPLFALKCASSRNQPTTAVSASVGVEAKRVSWSLPD